MSRAIGNLKICSKCKIQKDISEFTTSKTFMDGRYPSCKGCKWAVDKIWRSKNPDKVLASYEKYKKLHKNEMNIRSKNYYLNHKEDYYLASIEYVRLNKDKINKKQEIRRKDNKIKALQYKGNSCQKCGYNKSSKALHFHHISPENKSFEVSKLLIQSRNWEVIQTELDKCILLCGNCHSEEHDKEININTIEYTVE